MADARSEAEAARVRAQARQLYSAGDVRAAVARMAAQATPVLAGKDPVVLAVMHGGLFTTVELCSHFDFPYTFDFVHATRYGERLTGSDLSWRVAPAPRLAGRTVLAVDDILDRGVTLAALREALLELGVAELYTAVLVSKTIPGVGARPPVDFVGLDIEDVYVFGCGMDYKGYWRGLPALYAVNDE